MFCLLDEPCEVKYENMPWNDIWDCLNRPVLNSHVRDVMFLWIHNIYIYLSITKLRTRLADRNLGSHGGSVIFSISVEFVDSFNCKFLLLYCLSLFVRH